MPLREPPEPQTGQRSGLVQMFLQRWKKTSEAQDAAGLLNIQVLYSEPKMISKWTNGSEAPPTGGETVFHEGSFREMKTLQVF